MVGTHVLVVVVVVVFSPTIKTYSFLGERERQEGGREETRNFLQTKGSRDIGLLDHPDIGLVEMTYPLYQ